MENPTYYSILIAEVRYDKRLTHLQKLLYSEITALTNKTGECWASNRYFAELYEVSETWVSLSIKKLVTLGYLESRIDVEKGNIRYLRLKTISAPIEVELNRSLTTVKDPYLTTVKVNNININNKNNTVSKKKFSSKEDVTETVIKDIADTYNFPFEFVEDAWDSAQNWLEAHGKVMKNYKAFLTNWVKKDYKDTLAKHNQSKNFKRKGGYAEITDY